MEQSWPPFTSTGSGWRGSPLLDSWECRFQRISPRQPTPQEGPAVDALSETTAEEWPQPTAAGCYYRCTIESVLAQCISTMQELSASPSFITCYDTYFVLVSSPFTSSQVLFSFFLLLCFFCWSFLGYFKQWSRCS